MTHRHNFLSLHVFLAVHVLLAVLALACGPSPAALAAQVGTTVVNGRTVILEDNNTWRYADQPSAGAAQSCDNFPGVALCIKDSGWTFFPKSGAFQAVYNNAGRYFMGLIQEPYGSVAGVSPEALQNIILANVANISKIDISQLPVLGASTEVPNAPGARSVTFSTKVANVPFIYRNIFKVRENDSLQIIFWSVGSAITPEFSTKIDETMAKIKLD